MKINVKGYRILMKPEVISDEIKGKTITLIKSEITKDSEKRNIQKGVVLGMGPDCYTEDKAGEPYCKVGDTILINRGSGHNIYDDKDNWFIIVNEEDVLATIEED